MLSRYCLVALAFVVTALAGPAAADGMLMPVHVRPGPDSTPPAHFSVRYHRVHLEITDQVLNCSVDQVFHNETNSELEGIYLFPAPAGATITKFSMEVDGKPTEGRLLSKDEARSIYEGIVRKRKDPALLEYVDRTTFRARVFPIPPNGDKRIQMSYAQLLTVDNGLCEVVYPLDTERFSSKPIDEVTVVADIRPGAPLATVYSPSHELEIDKKADDHFVASFEQTKVVPDTDFRLFYTLADQEFGLKVLTHRPKAGEDGYFLLMASPRRSAEVEERTPKDVVFVLDTSGSMKADGKIDQAKGALKFCLESLRADDRFGIVAFSTAVNALGGSLSSVEESRSGGLEFVDDLAARGGTNLGQALEAALSAFDDPGRPQIVVLLSDGMPTVGLTRAEEILKLASEKRKQRTRLFAFGVGHDVDVPFLDQLTEQNGGTSDYVRPKEDIEVKVSTFFGKLSNPVLTNLSLDFGRVTAHDYYPQVFPDLFQGGELLVLGRYRGSGDLKLRLLGEYGGAPREFEYPVSFPEQTDAADFVPRLWAARKIGFLLDEIRLNQPGRQELVDEVVQLSREFGIMTEYTSFLVEEPTGGPAPVPGMAAAGGMLGGMAGRAATDEAASRLDRAKEARMGGYAISQRQNALNLRAQAQAPRNEWIDAEGQVQQIQGVRYVAGRAFYNRSGVWVDARYRPEQRLTNVQALSEAQFQLGRAMPALNQYFSIGDRVLVEVNGQAVMLGPEGRAELTEAEVADLTRG